MLLCKHQFQVSYLRYTWAADLFETSVLLEELQLAYSRRSKKLPTDSFSKHLSNRTSSDNCPLKLWLGPVQYKDTDYHSPYHNAR